VPLSARLVQLTIRGNDPSDGNFTLLRTFINLKEGDKKYEEKVVEGKHCLSNISTQF
jgi:hypothetical protein